MKLYWILPAIVLYASCSTTSKFPVSAVVPAAEITASKKKDKNNNYVVGIKAENLASPDRLVPPQSTYIVWFVTESNSSQNAGLLNISNGKTAKIEFITPFDIKAVFITAENQGNVTYPTGLEISRTIF